MSDIVVSVDLRSQLGPARNQGHRPTCLAFATSDAHAALRQPWAPLSCEYAFYHAQRRAARTPDQGALLSSMLETLRLDGQPEEGGWPYLPATPTDITSWHPPAKVGPLFGRGGAASSLALGAIAGELDQGRPVVLLLMLSRSFYNRRPDGVVDPAVDEVPEPQRRHAVIAVGHGTVDGQPAVLIRNSWGPSWGVEGYGWLTECFVGPRIFGAAVLREEVDVSPRSVAA
ncbi:MAG: C1 family peptidase [Devosia sp.]|nr:C1 family peptidase [Devosia sp.]